MIEGSVTTSSKPSGPSPDEPQYLELLAREIASENCVRCSFRYDWKTAALIYEGLEWKYYYCYECKGWFKRHFRYRYAVVPVDDGQDITLLVKHVELQRDMFEADLENISWFKRRLSGASRFFQRFLP